MKSIRIANKSVSAVVYGYGIAEIENEATVVYLDLAPQHPKVIGAIWASLVNGAREWVRLTDENTDETRLVRGLNRRYHRLTMDAPRIAGRARPKHIRLVAPLACQVEKLTRPFVVLDWSWNDTTGQTQHLCSATGLAAMLERDTPLPILIGWGEYSAGGGPGAQLRHAAHSRRPGARRLVDRQGAVGRNHQSRHPLGPDQSHVTHQTRQSTRR